MKTLSYRLFLICIFLPSSAFALSFQPTEAEWATWPAYCKARYVVSGAGRASEFASRASGSEVNAHRAAIGDAAWGWLHHYCAGLIYVDRARQKTSKQEADYLLHTAERQFMGHYVRVSKSDSFFPQLANTLGRLYREWNDPAKALKFTNEAIEYHPTFAESYSLAAMIYREQGELPKARDVLIQGDAATGASSAEIHYFLGLILVELDDLDSAVDYAKSAYALGYPLPGLRVKLQRLGRSLD